MKKISSFISLMLVTAMLLSVLTGCSGNVESLDTSTTSTETETETPSETVDPCVANGHTWVEANYQSPKTCSVCNATDGEKLPADFETYNLTDRLIDRQGYYDYVTGCASKDDLETVGKLNIVSYRVVASNDDREALEGYEWRRVVFQIKFKDDNAWQYGTSYLIHLDSYYDIAGLHESENQISENLASATVNYNGKDYPDVLVENEFEWDDRPASQTSILTATFTIRMPIGYDGFVFSFLDSRIEQADGQLIFDYADENTLFFRLT